MRELNQHNRFPLLRKLKQKRSHQRQAATSNRWTGWAQTVGMRYLRIAIGPQSLSLVLAQKHDVIYSRLERWQHAAFTIFPKINITLSRFVPLNRMGASATSLLQAHTQSPSRNWTQVSPLLHLRGHNVSTPIAGQGEKTNVGRRHSSGESRSIGEGILDARRHHLDLQHQIDLQPPLTRVFARFRDPDGREVSPRLIFDTPLSQQSLQFVQRGVGRQRIEEQGYPVLRTLQQRKPPNSIDRAEETVIHSPRELNTMSAEKIASLSRSPINLEQLTDQIVSKIDSRIVAHRERLGRVF